MKKNILIVGCNSKIAKLFTETYKDQYVFYGTYLNSKPDLSNIYEDQYQLDLNDTQAIVDFIDRVDKIIFSAVIFFASTYNQDSDNPEQLLKQMITDQQVNAIAPCVIAKSLNYEPLGRVLLLGDSGLSSPEPKFMSYSLSKMLLEKVCKLIAVELKGKAISACFLLGPTMAKEELSAADKHLYYDRNIASVDNVPLGLVHYMHFILEDKDVNVTGSKIYYDGGTYLRRS